MNTIQTKTPCFIVRSIAEIIIMVALLVQNRWVSPWRHSRWKHAFAKPALNDYVFWDLSAERARWVSPGYRDNQLPYQNLQDHLHRLQNILIMNIIYMIHKHLYFSKRWIYILYHKNKIILIFETPVYVLLCLCVSDYCMFRWCTPALHCSDCTLR